MTRPLGTSLLDMAEEYRYSFCKVNEHLSDPAPIFIRMNHIEFSVSRLRQIWDMDRDQPEFLAEVAYLYDQIVQTGTHEPIIEMGMKLMISFEEVGAAVSNTMAWGYLKEPKRGSNGGTITNKARKVLGQPIVKPAPKAPSVEEKPKGMLNRIIKRLS